MYEVKSHIASWPTNRLLDVFTLCRTWRVTIATIAPNVPDARPSRCTCNARSPRARRSTVRQPRASRSSTSASTRTRPSCNSRRTSKAAKRRSYARIVRRMSTVPDRGATASGARNATASDRSRVVLRERLMRRVHSQTQKLLSSSVNK